MSFERATSEPWHFPLGLHLLLQWWPDAQEHGPSLRKSLVFRSSLDSLLKKIWKGGNKHLHKNIATALWSCYALVYGKGRGLRLIHWSPNHYDKDNSVRGGNFLCLKRRREGRWRQRVKCVCARECFDRSDTVHESARWECTVQSQHPQAHERLGGNFTSSSWTCFSHKTRVIILMGEFISTAGAAVAPSRPGWTPGMCGSVWVAVGRESGESPADW